MKNIFLVSTDNPSKIFYIAENFHLEKGQLIEPKSYHNVYITSDEEIKEGNWRLDIRNSNIYKSDKADSELYDNSFRKKIILTTDQDLIADGVQAIDDTFLEWFVNNPSCESVVVNFNYKKFRWSELTKSQCYKIIIPQEEPKQETLEEAAKKRYIEGVYVINGIDICDASRECFIEGANYQAERMYSEEEAKKLAFDFYYDMSHKLGVPEYLITENSANVDVWFKQFKKK
jgi:hypothetical protein